MDSTARTRLFSRFFFQERRGDGVYVEVGAYDGRTYSNSLFFEVALGWGGVLVEAHAVTMSGCTSRIGVCIRCTVSYAFSEDVTCVHVDTHAYAYVHVRGRCIPTDAYACEHQGVCFV